MKIFNKLFNRDLNRFISYNVLANLLNQSRWFIFIWIATQYLSVSEYAVFSLIITLMMTAIDLSDLGINASTTRFIAEFYTQNKRRLYFNTLFYSLKRKGLSIFLAILVLFFFSNNISNLLFQNAHWGFLVQLSALGVGSGLLNGLNLAVLQGKKCFHIVTKIAIYIFVISVLILGGFYVVGYWNLVGFIWIYIIIMGVSLLLSIWPLRKEFFVSIVHYRNTTYIKKEFNTFGIWMFIWAIFCVLQSRIDLIMLAQLTTLEQVAYYDLAMKYTRPFMMIFAAYGQVLNPLMAGCKTIDELRLSVKKTYSFLIRFSLVLLILIVLAKYMIMEIVGIEYGNSIVPLQVIFFSLIFFIWTMPFNTALYALKKPYVFSVETIFGVIVTIIGNYFLLPLYGAIGAAYVFLVVQIASLIISKIFYSVYVKK